jgi:hypothetical protein
MNARRIRFFLCTLCLHLGVLGLFWREAPFAHGSANDTRSAEAARSTLMINIVADEKVWSTHSQRQGESASSVIRMDSIKKMLAMPQSQAKETTDLPIDSASSSQMAKTDLLSNPSSEMVSLLGYMPAGLLTRLPAPLADIDLDAPVIENTAVTGKIDLTVLIDATGTVSDVIASVETENLRAFSERVAERFKSARFTPGEINGNPVKSQLRISVVSETLSTNGN